jgi:ribosomal protein S12 methylthiotransferase
MPQPDPEPPTTVAIVTLGCGRNEVDSQNAAGLLAAAGYRVVADPEQADAVVVNTCAFVEAAKRESIETVLDAAALKEQGRTRTVLVTGCLAERYTGELRAELPEADAIVPFSDYGRLPQLLGGGTQPEARFVGRAASAPPNPPGAGGRLRPRGASAPRRPPRRRPHRRRVRPARARPRPGAEFLENCPQHGR